MSFENENENSTATASTENKTVSQPVPVLRHQNCTSPITAHALKSSNNLI
jgi:hypothetical protein